MNIGFVGLGKLGLPCALAMESKGHNVIGYDISHKVKQIIESKNIPYQETGAQKLLEKSKIKLVSLKDLVTSSEIIFIAVQTPHHEKYEGTYKLPTERLDFDYSFLKNASKELAQEIEKQGQDKIVVIISTVLPGTVDNQIKPLLNKHVKLCYNPFFIAMGTAIDDFLNPEFVLFGIDSPEAVAKAEDFYRTTTKAPFYKTSIKNAELIKVSYNTFISMKIVFANVLMELCHKTGTDVDEVINVLKLANKRLISEKYFSGGMGDGGSCHPRDNIAMSWLARKFNLSFDWFENIMLAREKQTEWLADLMEQYDLPKVILGKSYKPESNIITGSPSMLLKNILEERGHKVVMYDPYIDTKIPVELEEAMKRPCVFLIGTKHPDFTNFDFPKGSIVLDPWRYILDKKGIKLIRIGDSVAD